jgi:DNA (cytosine-5)-methyltransferase 1
VALSQASDRLAKGGLLTALRFVDLFAGLGGFHVAMERLGHQCVLSSEIDPDLRKLYALNFGIEPQGDIRSIALSDIPGHDILCAGFPCQPFSKAGRQAGLACTTNGDLPGIIVNWARAARPRYLLLENVPNLIRHDDGHTWRWLSQELRHSGYSLNAKVISPHEHGVPQIRERLFIVGCRDGLDQFAWPTPCARPTHVREVLELTAGDEGRIPPRILEALETWDAFVRSYPRNRRKPWFPIWAAEFGATYPFSTIAPLMVPSDKLRSYRGSFGRPIVGDTREELTFALPPYARTDRPIPAWKARFLELNRELYEQNRSWIDPWLPRLAGFEHSFQKFEWNFDGTEDGAERSLWGTIVQLRGSGIRAKSPNAAPALVAASSSQVPIIAWERRYMSVRERARLQDLGSLLHLPAGQAAATRALGNAVNAKVAELVGRQLFGAKSSFIAAA